MLSKFTVEFDDEKPFMDKVDEAYSEDAYFCQKHNNYMALSEPIRKSDTFRNFVSEWTSSPDPCLLQNVVNKHELSKQICFNITLMNEHEYFGD